MDAAAERYLVVLTLGEVLLLCYLAALLAHGLFGDGTFLVDVPRSRRLVALAVLVVEAAVPSWILFDVRGHDVDTVWVHVAAMPLVNLLGLLAYLDERKRRGE